MSDIEWFRQDDKSAWHIASKPDPPLRTHWLTPEAPPIPQILPLCRTHVSYDRRGVRMQVTTNEPPEGRICLRCAKRASMRVLP